MKRSSKGIRALALAGLVLLSVLLSGCGKGGIDGRGNDNPVCLVTKPDTHNVFQCK